MAWNNVIDAVAAASAKRRRTRVSAVNFIVVHHSVTKPDENWERMLDIHTNKGYSSIGYHYVVRGSDGEVYKCLPVDPAVVGAHAKNQNSESIGVCVTGNYEKYEPGNAALDALKSVLDELKRLYPKARVLAHREMRFSNTACPGKHLLAVLKAWRQAGLQ